MIKRSMIEILEDIKTHREILKSLDAEIKSFQNECPHPENFVKKEYKTCEDEYGRTDGSYEIHSCLLCGNREIVNEQDKY